MDAGELLGSILLIADGSGLVVALGAQRGEIVSRPSNLDTAHAGRGHLNGT